MSNERLLDMKKLGKDLMQGPWIQKLGDKPNTTKDERHAYKVVNASRSPCQCQYMYAGTRKHRFFQFGDLEPGFQSKFAECLDPLNKMSALMDKQMLDRFEITQSRLPNCAIVNEYQTQNNSIGWHSDADDLFDAMNSQAVIFSFNFHRDGIFAVAPMDERLRAELCGQSGGSQMTPAHLWERLNYMPTNKNIRKNGHIVYTFVPENSLIVMGGHFQSQMMHASLSHSDIVNPSAVPTGTPTDGFCQENEEAKKQCFREQEKCIGFPRHSGNCTEMSRKVFTYRFVVRHQDRCQFHHREPSPPLPAAGRTSDGREVLAIAQQLLLRASGRPDLNQEAQQFPKHDGPSPTCKPAAQTLSSQADAWSDHSEDTDVPSDVGDLTVASFRSDCTISNDYDAGYVQGVKRCWDTVHAVFESVLNDLDDPNCILGQPGGFSNSLTKLWSIMQSCCENILKLLDNCDGMHDDMTFGSGFQEMLTKIQQRSGLFSCQIRIAKQLNEARYAFVDILERHMFDFSRGKRVNCKSTRAFGTVEWLETVFAAILASKARQMDCAERQSVVLLREELVNLWSLSTSLGKSARCSKHDIWDDHSQMEFMPFLHPSCQGQKHGNHWEITFVETNADYTQRSVRYRLLQGRDVAKSIRIMQAILPELGQLNHSILKRQPDLYAVPEPFGRAACNCPFVLWLRCVPAESGLGTTRVRDRSRSRHGRPTWRKSPRQPRMQEVSHQQVWNQQLWHQPPWHQQPWDLQPRHPVAWHQQPWAQSPGTQMPWHQRPGHPPTSPWQ